MTKTFKENCFRVITLIDTNEENLTLIEWMRENPQYISLDTVIKKRNDIVEYFAKIQFNKYDKQEKIFKDKISSLTLTLHLTTKEGTLDTKIYKKEILDIQI